jgi:hypothetical protein
MIRVREEVRAVRRDCSLSQAHVLDKIVTTPASLQLGHGDQAVSFTQSGLACPGGARNTADISII